MPTAGRRLDDWSTERTIGASEPDVERMTPNDDQVEHAVARYVAHTSRRRGRRCRYTERVIGSHEATLLAHVQDQLLLAAQEDVVQAVAVDVDDLNAVGPVLASDPHVHLAEAVALVQVKPVRSPMPIAAWGVVADEQVRQVVPVQVDPGGVAAPTPHVLDAPLRRPVRPSSLGSLHPEFVPFVAAALIGSLQKKDVLQAVDVRVPEDAAVSGGTPVERVNEPERYLEAQGASLVGLVQEELRRGGPVMDDQNVVPSVCVGVCDRYRVAGFVLSEPDQRADVSDRCVGLASGRGGSGHDGQGKQAGKVCTAHGPRKDSLSAQVRPG